MEPKKTAGADLTRKSFLFFNIGLVASLSIVTFAFTYKVSDESEKRDLTSNVGQREELLEVPVTEQLPPSVPKLVQPQIVEVPNSKKIEETIALEMDPETTEIRQETAPLTVEIEEEDPNTLFTIVEESASPVGGIGAFNQYIAEHIVYPPQARRMAIQGKVFVEFIVERDGTITSVKTIKGIGAGCDEEAVRVIALAPKWNPGKQRGRPVRQKMILPVNFRTN